MKQISGRMVVLALAAIAALAALDCAAAWAQSTGTSFPTPNGQIAPGSAILVPSGSITNGQPVMAPPGPTNGVPVQCENCSPSAPTTVSSNPVNGTIATTDTFQVLLAFNAQRRACNIQNNGTHTMYFSVAPSPSLANSWQVAPAGSFDCADSGNIVDPSEVQVTGTAGDAFAGSWQ